MSPSSKNTNANVPNTIQFLKLGSIKLSKSFFYSFFPSYVIDNVINDYTFFHGEEDPRKAVATLLSLTDLYLVFNKGCYVSYKTIIALCNKLQLPVLSLNEYLFIRNKIFDLNRNYKSQEFMKKYHEILLDSIFQFDLTNTKTNVLTQKIVKLAYNLANTLVTASFSITCNDLVVKGVFDLIERNMIEHENTFQAKRVETDDNWVKAKTQTQELIYETLDNSLDAKIS